MKRILTLALLLCALSVTVAHAGKIVSYNSSYKQPIRIVQTVPNGPQVSVTQSRSVFFEMDGTCLRLVLVTTQYVRTVTYSYGTLVSDDTVSHEVGRQVLSEFCL